MRDKILKSKYYLNWMNTDNLVNYKYILNINRKKIIIKMNYRKNQMKSKIFKIKKKIRKMTTINFHLGLNKKVFKTKIIRMIIIMI